MENKIDLKGKRVITNEEVNVFIKKNELIHVECSAQNGEGIKELFNTIAKNLGESNFSKSEYINIDFNSKENKNEDSRSNYIINNIDIQENTYKNQTVVTNSKLNGDKKNKSKSNKKKKKKQYCC